MANAIRSILGVLVISTLLPFAAFAGADMYPLGPDSSMTPGQLCQHADDYRYPEHIPYCNRAVTTGQKNEIIKAYDQRLGFSIEQMDRQDFKIDHLIPLCAGGSNDPSNLWPQHKSVYQQTDPIEPLLCQRMQEGKLKQAEAVQLVLRAKHDLSQVPAVMDQLTNM